MPTTSLSVLWDLTTTDMPFYDQMIKNPDYFRKAKGLESEIIYMTPNTYMMKCAKIQNSTLEAQYREVGRAFVDTYRDRMLAGVKFPIPVLDYAGGLQEGRNRAIAAERAGATTIPVLVVSRVGQVLPDAHPLILKQYPLGQVPEKMPINMDIPIPPLRGTVAPKTKVIVPENAALRTNQELDRAVEHLGYQSVSLSEEEVAGLEKPIPTDVELINESQRRLRRLKVIPDGQLNTRQLAHLNLARVLAQTICYRNPVSGVYAASIPPASDRVRTVGTYGTKNKAGYIALDALDTGRITIDTLIHELGHHRQYLKTGEAEDLEIEHAEAMTSIAGETVAIVATGKLDKLLVDVAW